MPSRIKSYLRRRCKLAEMEIEKLRSIIATHDLCHNLHGTVGADDFADGCAAEQRKIFGCAPDADEVKRLALMLEGRDKAIKIINAGFESLCENHDALKQENRKLARQVETAKTILAINGVKANLEI